MLNFSGCNIPTNLQQELTKYIERGADPGPFLDAVLSNDLIRAVGYASASDLSALKDLVNWLTYHAPQGSFGSAAIVNRWINVKNPEAQNS